jgi:U3 small nucleolar ribonucleoprotein protein IMP4
LPQIRRQVRERREYIYRKAQESQERAIYEKKQSLKDALATGKALPTELRKEAANLGRDWKFDEAQAGTFKSQAFISVSRPCNNPHSWYSLPSKEPGTHIDDEYTNAGIIDPKIVITTSRNPSSRLLQFAKVSPFDPFLIPPVNPSHNLQEIRLVFPNSSRINRGNFVVKELAEACRANEVSDLIILHEHRGTPGMVNRENLAS